MARLSPSLLNELADNIRRPPALRAELRPRIVHLGLGAFFKAHGALYTEDCNRSGDWGIVGASLQHATQRDALRVQGYLYSATEIGAGGRRTRVVGNVLDVLVAPENPPALIRRMADAETEIVSLTVTEKGYCHNPATGELRFDHPDIAADLVNPTRPRSAIGFLVAALAERRRLKLSPFTIVSCDNLPGNGRLLSALVTAFARARSADLATWIGDTVSFPSSMVDRIVPALTTADLTQVAADLGVEDQAAVSHEPFRQWVVQDAFSGARPRWENAGVQFVKDVTPFEIAKLRMLNGAHSALAYAGYLAGHETIADVVGDPPFAEFVRKLWAEEIIPTLQAPSGMDVQSYAAQLFERFQNPGIRHRTWQIAMDGSQKLPQRLLGTVRDRLRQKAPFARLAFAVAAWLRYVEGVDEKGQAIDVRDPMLALITLRLQTAGSDKVKAVLSLQDIFGADLAAHPGFGGAVEAAYQLIAREGVRKALAHLE